MNVNDINILDIVEDITEGFYILDLDWKIIYINKEATAIFKMPKEELIGKIIWEIFPDATLLSIHDFFHNAMSTKQPMKFEFFYPMMNQWFEIRAYPSSKGLYVYVQEITASKIHTLTREQYYHSLFENNPDPVCSVDLRGHFTSVNNALVNMTGYSPEELIDKPFSPIVVEEDLEKANYYFAEAVKGQTQTYEFRMLHKSGHVIYCKGLNFPIVINDQTIGLFGIVKDITLQKIAEEHIERSKKLSLVGQLSASIAHEIRNPLTTIKGFSQLFGKESGLNQEYVKLLLSEMNRIELITSELLFLAKPQAVEYQIVKPVELLADVVTLLKAQANMKNIEINLVCPENEITTCCVVNQIKQVFINLIKNAIESMSDNGTIEVVLSEVNDQELQIEVIDQGCGISEELAPKIGMPFYSTKEKGTGLGMVTTYKIIHEHKWNINFDSEVGKGTTFRVVVPRYNHDETITV